MRIKVDVILGFLKAGKTSLVNMFLKSGEVQGEKIVIVQYENGNTEPVIPQGLEAVIVKRNMKDGIDDNFLKELTKEFMPERIIIEYNGMGNTEEFMAELHSVYFKKLFSLDRVINVIDAHYANLFLLNMKDKMLSDIQNSSIIVINNYDEQKKENIRDLISFIKFSNSGAKILKYKDKYEEEKAVVRRKLCLNSYNEKLTLKEVFKYLLRALIIAAVIAAAVYINFTGTEKEAASLFNNFKIKFISIMLESLPFILIGSFIASLIQIFVPDTWIYSILRKNKIASSFMAAVLGVIFPICDCGTIPLAFGFLNKGVPINAVFAFMMAAPIVNPISIMSTLYAFPDHKEVVILRLAVGILIAVFVSLFLSRVKKEDVINAYSAGCDCELCNGSYKNASPLMKVKGLFISTGDEFIRVAKFMIAGAVFSSIFQLLNADNLLNNFPEGRITYLLFMMLMAFLLSVCSTSDAFIAKGFLSAVPLNAILGFLVMGPMIDIKNTIMLTGYFKKSFVLKYIITILIVTFLVMICIPV